MLDTSILIRKGKYSITNSVLTHSEFYLDTIQTRSSFNYGILELSSEITIHNSIMTRKQFSEFNNVGQNQSDIWDKWETVSWYAQISVGNTIESFYGRYVFQYEFTKDSNKCFLVSKFHNAVNNSDSEDSTYLNFTYNLPYLDFSHQANILVKFINNKMYWFFNDQPSNLIKVK